MIHGRNNIVIVVCIAELGPHCSEYILSRCLGPRYNAQESCKMSMWHPQLHHTQQSFTFMHLFPHFRVSGN